MRHLTQWPHNVVLMPIFTCNACFFCQFLFNTDDADVEKLLLHLTLMPVSNIRIIVSDHVAEPHQRIAQRTLARAVCTAVHGAEATHRAEVSSIALFRGDSLEVSVARPCAF